MVASRELRNNTRGVLQRVEGGEEIIITVAGRPVATLRPLSIKPRFMPKDEFIARVLSHQADPGLAMFLKELVPDTTDDFPWP